MVAKGNELFEILVWGYQTSRKIDVSDLIRNAPQYYKEWLQGLLADAPQHILIETGLILFIIWLMFIRRTVDPSKASKTKLTARESEELIDSWVPEPLIPELSEKAQNIANNMTVIEGVDGNYLKVKGVDHKVLNLSSFDFFGFARDSGAKEVARAALNKYGCGSCGPRGFYGTIDQHLKIEDEIAKFMKTEEAISYSDGATAVSSSIPAFSKKGDILLIDDACSEPILTGANLSRSTLQFFKHNDMKDLRAILTAIANDDRRLKRDSTQQRRFIVVEGLYRNTGELCPLPELLKLKNEFCYRLILDESLSFGTIGKTGRGITEHFGIPITDVEILTVAMDTALGSVGGLCVGTREVVDHQRLSGAGYCFSAAAPPFLSAVATYSVKQLAGHPELLEVLHSRASQLHNGLKTIKGAKLLGDEFSPVMHLMLATPCATVEEEEALIEKISKGCLHNGVGVVTSKFSLVNPKVNGSSLRPSLRFAVSATLSEQEINKAVGVVKTVFASSLKN